MNRKTDSIIALILFMIISIIIMIIALPKGVSKYSFAFFMLGIYALIRIVLKLSRGAIKVNYRDMILMV